MGPSVTYLGDAENAEWYKFLGLALFKLVGREEVVITLDDMLAIERAFPDGVTILAHDQLDGLHLRVMSIPDGAALERTARKPS